MITVSEVIDVSSAATPDPTAVLPRSRVSLTAWALTGVPSVNFSPLRMLKNSESPFFEVYQEVASAGWIWPVGEILGSEAELIDRYGISRAVFREAVRLVEHQHVARMRRGPGGGLVVEEPTVGAVISAVVLYLLRVDATLDEVFDTRLVLEEIVVETA